MAPKQLFVICGNFTAVALILQICRTIFPDSISHYYTWSAECILYLFLATVSCSYSYNLFCDERIKPDNKAVLITGCDSGFGNMMARRLDSKGFQVFASCLFPHENGATDLKRDCSDHLHVLHLDVTKQESVEKAFSYVKQNLGNNVLWAIVNNAGICKGLNLDFCSMEDIKDTMEVNAFGQVRVTKAFLPLLKESKGRVVNITSIIGRLSFAGLSAYAMSKRAAVAFTECLSQDMHPWGVRAISIEPEFFRTHLTSEKNAAQIIDAQLKNADEDILTSYGDEYLTKIQEYSKIVKRLAVPNCEPVMNDVESAITQKYPKHVYKSRKNIFTRFFWSLLEHIPYAILENMSLLFFKFSGFPLPRNAINSTTSSTFDN